MKYRKKPVVIHAHRLGDEWSEDSMPIWEGVNQNKIVLHMSADTLHATIETPEGTMTAQLGDYIIRGVKGEFYPCKPDVFEATYEPAPPDGMQPCSACGLNAWGGACPDGANARNWRYCETIRRRVTVAGHLLSVGKQPHPDTQDLLARLGISHEAARALADEQARLSQLADSLDMAGAITVEGQHAAEWCRDDPIRMAAFLRAAVCCLTLENGERTMGEIADDAHEIARVVRDALEDLGAPCVEMES